ncbi:MAG: menaquinone biosynthesis decarboxylase [Bacteroidota bacterium]
MNYSSLNDFVIFLESLNEIVRIKERVNPDLEITEITDRISKSQKNNKALLFENNGTKFPLLINMMGSETRMSAAIYKKNFTDIASEIQELFKKFSKPHKNIWQKIKLIPELNAMSKWLPRIVKEKNPRCRQNIHTDPDINIFPVLKCWPEDAGKFITLPVVITKDPISCIRNVGMYRMQIFNKNTTGMHWHKHKVGARHYNYYKDRKLKMPVTVILGGDPVYTYAATAPLPDNFDEFLFAGFLRKKSVKLVKCLTNDLEVPSDADIVIEGYIDTSEELSYEGPFGDHTGFYSLADYYPKFHITCITHANDAIFPATIVGVPPQEDAFIGKATERIFLTPIKMSVLPEIEDLYLPFEGVAHNIVIVKIKKQFDGQAYKVMNALMGAGQMMFTKVLTVFNESVDIHDDYNILKAISLNVNVKNDIYISKGVTDILDHSSEVAGLGGKVMFDATNTDCIDFVKPLIKRDEIIDKYKEIRQINAKLINLNISLLIISVLKTEQRQILSLAKSLVNDGFIKYLKFLIFVDEEVDVNELQITTWYVGNNIDPIRDFYFLSGENFDMLIIDGTAKNSKMDNFNRDWPNIVIMDDNTIDRIDQIWDKLNIGEFIKSPSVKLKNLVNNKGAIANSKKNTTNY